MVDSAALDFAYKYPFTREAKGIVHDQGSELKLKYLEMARKQIDIATTSGLEYSSISINSVKLDYVMAYLYSRMLLSALRRADMIRSYAEAEAKRSSVALLASENPEIIEVASQLGIRITETAQFRAHGTAHIDGDLSISFIDYVTHAPKAQGFELVNQRLSNGIVLLGRNNMVRVIERAMAGEIMKGLPIKTSELPKQVTEYSKGINLKAIPAVAASGLRGAKREEWIEKLLVTPIADVRHRTVNLILAPYLVNSKGLEVDEASRIISEYMEKCKQIDPNTKINDSYIRYQCSYAKKRGLRPLSLVRAKELLGSQLDIELQLGDSK
ncbi:MAG: DNA primase noncatalytic subunit PriX [Candidatus Micrarchaeota archaeon]|nr:DNA primase noncatalytic subunit PriX [Candidatus Micrarchaeota archaeon]